MRADSLRGQMGGGRALEIETFLRFPGTLRYKNNSMVSGWEIVLRGQKTGHLENLQCTSKTMIFLQCTAGTEKRCRINRKKKTGYVHCAYSARSMRTVLYGYDIVALFPPRRYDHYEKAFIKQTTLRHLLNNFRYRILDRLWQLLNSPKQRVPYLMIYRGPSFLAVVWLAPHHPLPPFPSASILSVSVF